LGALPCSCFGVLSSIIATLAISALVSLCIVYQSNLSLSIVFIK